MVEGPSEAVSRRIRLASGSRFLSDWEARPAVDSRPVTGAQCISEGATGGAEVEMKEIRLSDGSSVWLSGS